MLDWTIYVSFLGALVVGLWPGRATAPVRWVALGTALAGAVLAGLGWWEISRTGGAGQTLVNAAWVPELGIRYHLAADGLSAALALLTGVAAVAGVLFSWNIEHRVREFFALFLWLVGAVYGVFLSFDLFLFFVFYELAIVPKYFLIAIWGSTRREYGAMKLVLYSFVGSAMVLVALLAAYVMAGAQSFAWSDLVGAALPRGFQMWAFPVMFTGFAILAGLWPWHTWAPTGHVAAPTAASMLLAGVVMKLGAYGCLRVAMPLFPEGLRPWRVEWCGLGSWPELFALLSVVGIVWGALVALAQRDFKFVIGYSSVSHMGFVLLGLMTITVPGWQGAVLQMVSHGLIAGLLFAVVGRMIYDRTHTRDLSELEPMGLGRALPFAAGTFVLAGAASAGMPGFSGFMAEVHVLLGAWQSRPILAVVTGVGVLLGAAYIWRAMQRAFFGVAPAGEEPRAPRESLPPMTCAERIGAIVLLAGVILLGLWPGLVLETVSPVLTGSVYGPLQRGGLW
ncbi:complex I subunit 4 family protein [Limisphaera sp. 4302-co]|uniref:complex I subunit 4 family protein n=1 Tax=Limisphaera sp. 4302-co TaxID=3400417 RepID=UPI003C29E4CB